MISCHFNLGKLLPPQFSAFTPQLFGTIWQSLAPPVYPYTLLVNVHTFSQRIISSMHRQRKVICYLTIPLVGGFEAYLRGVSDLDQCFLCVKIRKNLDFLWRVSTHYLISLGGER